MNPPHRRPTLIPYAGVICRQHGTVDISQEDYDAQMHDVHSRWRCPLCKQFAEFDDNRFDQLHPEPEDNKP